MGYRIQFLRAMTQLLLRGSEASKPSSTGVRGPYERRHHTSTMYDADFCSSLGYIMTLDGDPVNTMNGFVRPLASTMSTPQTSCVTSLALYAMPR